jgi:hypothetical protein
MSVLDGVEPAAFWSRFEELTTIAGPLRSDEPATAWAKEWVAARGFESEQVPANGTQIAAAEADSPNLDGKRFMDHSVQVPVQICWIVIALADIGIAWLFFGPTPAPTVSTTSVP